MSRDMSHLKYFKFEFKNALLYGFPDIIVVGFGELTNGGHDTYHVSATVTSTKDDVVQ